MANSLYQALSGGQPSAVEQPSAPVPPGAPGVGAGSLHSAMIDPSVIQALQQAMKASSGQPGQQVAMGVSPEELSQAVRQAGNVPMPNKPRKPNSGIPQSSDEGHSPEEAARRKAIRASFGYKD